MSEAAPRAPRSTATAQGLVAILLWSSLATLTTAVPTLPPFQLAAMAFAVATLVGLAYTLATRTPLAAIWDVPPASWALGVYGLLGYHACYFTAFRNAPALEVNLVNYLWPLLIVVFSALLPARFGGARLRWWHVTGALMGFAGCALILAGASTSEARPSGSAIGYVAAAAAAVIWSSYSVATRVYARVPTAAVTGTCAATALGAFLLHRAFETTVWPDGARQWAMVLAAGLGPVGLAFYLWDAAMKHGNLRFVGVASYATPLLSTLLLAAFGMGHAGPLVWLAALLVSAGALLAARDIWDRRLFARN